MIVRFGSDQLRRMAEQLDALSRMEAAGADHLAPNTPIRLDGAALAYAYWWDDGQQYLAEIINFPPGDAQPLAYHDRATSGNQ